MHLLIRATRAVLLYFRKLDWNNPIIAFAALVNFLVTGLKKFFKIGLYQRDQDADLRILIIGGLGDQIVVSRWIREFSKNLLSPTKVIIFSSNTDLSKWLLSDIAQIVAFRDEIQLRKNNKKPMIQIGHEVNLFNATNSDIKSMLRPDGSSDFFTMMDLDLHSNERFDTSRGPVVASVASKAGTSRENHIFRVTNIAYPGALLPIFTSKWSGQLPKRYITIHQGFDENFHTGTPLSTKSYRNFQEVVDYIEDILDIPVIQVGIKKTSMRLETSICLLDQTTIYECADIIKNAMLHIDCESGLVHLATSLGVQCVVVFGPTPHQYFGYTNNLNLYSDACSPCWWGTPNWMAKCFLGHPNPVCTSTITPNDIIKAVEKLINLDYSSQRFP